MSDYDAPQIIIDRQGGGMGSFLLGALIGAGVALLLAPRSGRETREELRQGAARFRERAGDTVRGLQETVADTFDSVRGDVSDRVEAAREAFEAGRQAARTTRADMERRVEEARARVRAGVEAARKPPASDRSSAAPPPAGTDAESETGFGI